jgi:hypothetical protein
MINPCLISINSLTHTVVSFYCVMWQETDRPSFSSLCCHLLTHKASQTRPPWHATQCHRKNQHEIPYTAKLHICPSERVSWHVWCWLYHRTTFTNLIIACHTAPARCQHVATFGNMWPGHHITAIWFYKLMMNNDCRYFQWQQEVHNSTDFYAIQVFQVGHHAELSQLCSCKYASNNITMNWRVLYIH